MLILLFVTSFFLISEKLSPKAFMFIISKQHVLQHHINIPIYLYGNCHFFSFGTMICDRALKKAVTVLHVVNFFQQGENFFISRHTQITSLHKTFILLTSFSLHLDHLFHSLKTYCDVFNKCFNVYVSS